MIISWSPKQSYGRTSRHNEGVTVVYWRILIKILLTFHTNNVKNQMPEQAAHERLRTRQISSDTEWKHCWSSIDAIICFKPRADLSDRGIRISRRLSVIVRSRGHKMSDWSEAEGIAGGHPTLQPHESLPLFGGVQSLVRWPRTTCHSLPFTYWRWRRGGRGVGLGNKTHDLTKRRVFFNVRSCMNLQRRDETKRDDASRSTSVRSALNIYDGFVPARTQCF